MAAEHSVVAIIAAFNEADVIRPVVTSLIDNGIAVYLLDHGSTDGTAEAVADLVGHGLIRIERFSSRDAADGAAGERFDLHRLLARKAELVATLDAAWFINHDADEFRESPWPNESLLDGIRRADAFGFNAIDFEVFDFVPTHDDLRPGDDPRVAFLYYEPSSPLNKLQIRCFKKPSGPLDLVSSGGHEARFAGRRVFPIRFLLRHYPFRNQAQAERKLFTERRPRYSEAEKEIGWHAQYADIAEGHRFVRPAAGLGRFDPVEARALLMVRSRALEESDLLRGELARRTTELAAAREEIAGLRRELDEAQARGTASERRLADVFDSWSWRLTRPLRLTYGWLLRRPGAPEPPSR